MAEEDEDEHLSDWEQAVSRTYRTTYWFNHYTGKSQWNTPDIVAFQSSSRKRVRIENEIVCAVKTAIIVPFRDLHVEQARSAHLNRFIPYMTEFMTRNNPNRQFKIYIIEQSDDKRKFNRGKVFWLVIILII